MNQRSFREERTTRRGGSSGAIAFAQCKAHAPCARLRLRRVWPTDRNSSNPTFAKRSCGRGDSQRTDRGLTPAVLDRRQQPALIPVYHRDERPRRIAEPLPPRPLLGSRRQQHRQWQHQQPRPPPWRRATRQPPQVLDPEWRATRAPLAIQPQPQLRHRSRRLYRHLRRDHPRRRHHDPPFYRRCTSCPNYWRQC